MKHINPNFSLLSLENNNYSSLNHQQQQHHHHNNNHYHHLHQSDNSQSNSNKIFDDYLTSNTVNNNTNNNNSISNVTSSNKSSSEFSNKRKNDSFTADSKSLYCNSSHAIFANENLINTKFKSVTNHSITARSYDYKSIHSYFSDGVKFTDKTEITTDNNNNTKRVADKSHSVNLTANRIFPIIVKHENNTSQKAHRRIGHKSESFDANCELCTISDCRNFFQTSHFVFKKAEPSTARNLSKLYTTSSVSMFSRINDLATGKLQLQQHLSQPTRLKINDLSTHLTEKSEPGELLDEGPSNGHQEVELVELPTVRLDEDLTGYTQLNQYKLKDQIGKGSYGIVKLAYNKLDNKNYAMKMISKQKLIKKTNQLIGRKKSLKKSNQPFDLIYREIAILKKLDHENVVKLIEVLDDPNEDNFCLVFEYVEKGPIINIPTDTPLSEDEAWKYFRQLIKGIEYLHFNKIIHRDIKPSNLLLTEDNLVKLVDFNISNEFDGNDAIISNSLGTPAFMPPEALGENTVSWLGKPLDIWAMGITLYSFVYGYCPFRDSCPIELRNKIQRDNVTFPDWPSTSDSFKDLILKLLVKGPLERITMNQIKEHDWITKNNSCPLITHLEKEITVTEDEVNNSVKMLYKLDTLILIKAMIKKRSFGNPFRASFSSLSLSDS